MCTDTQTQTHTQTLLYSPKEKFLHLGVGMMASEEASRFPLSTVNRVFFFFFETKMEKEKGVIINTEKQIILCNRKRRTV